LASIRSANEESMTLTPFDQFWSVPLHLCFY